MKVRTQIAVTALGLVVATAGVLYPINNKIQKLKDEITVREAEGVGDALVVQQLAQAQLEVEELEQAIAQSDLVLCPNSAAGRHAVESAVLQQVGAAGLRRVSTETQPNPMGPDVPSFGLTLIVEGDAFQLHEFLLGLESIKWLTRVLSLDVEPGTESRRTTLKIAVLMEDDPS